MTENMTCLSKISSTSNSLVENITATGGELLRRGPWTLEEDELLVRYVNVHGEGRWNLLAKRSGLKRTGKSCRLRWLNYLKPDVKRGNFTTQEQILILQLHSKWGNRWSRIAQHLPGRTDNEIKNYWRTRVQKQARHLRVDPNSKTFQDIVQFLWMPRLLQMIDNDNTSPSLSPSSSSPNNPTVQDHHHDQLPSHHSPCPSPLDSNTSHVKIQSFDHHHHNKELNNSDSDQTTSSKSCSVSSSGPSNILSGRNGLQYITISSSSNSTSLIEDFDYVDNYSNNNCYNMVDFNSTDYSCQMAYGDWTRYDHLADDTWNMDGLWQFRTSLV